MDQQNPNYVENENLKSEVSFLALGIAAGIAILLIILFTLNYFNILSLSTLYPKQLGWLPHRTSPPPTSRTGPYAFSVNGEQISWDEFDQRLAYAKGPQNIKDAKQARKAAYDSLIERWILKKEAQKRNINITKEDLDKLNKADTLSSLEEYQKALQDNILRSNLEPLLVSSRTGKEILIAFGFDRPELQGVNQQELALQLITSASNR